MAKDWIANATKNKGGLHRSLGVPENETIPEDKLEQGIEEGGRVAKQARLAETLKGFKKKGPKSLRDYGKG